ncbi:MAG: YIP1 family protein [Anaerolineales bacterium]|nr:MAG: YIP1 family protein [Anaerolineales bacterium]
MQAVLRLGVGALFLEKDAYEEMRDRENPFSQGLGLVAIISVLVALIALVGIVSDLVEGATWPSEEQVKDIVRQGLTRMPWYEAMSEDPESMREFERQFEMNWQRNAYRFGPFSFGQSLVGGISGAIFGGLGVFIGWLVCALLAHAFAQMLGGQGTLQQIFGCTALAVSPQVLNLAGLLPFVQVGGIVGTWMLACNYVAVKTVYRLSWSRAFWVTVLSQILLRVLFTLVGCGVGMVTGFLGVLPMALKGGL